jgi:hypothetical protein
LACWQLHSLQVDDLAAFSDFEIDRALTELHSQLDKQSAGFTDALGRYKDFQTVACFLVDPAVVPNPGPLKRTLQRIAPERVAHTSQECSSFALADFRSVVPVGWDASYDKHHILASAPGE